MRNTKIFLLFLGITIVLLLFITLILPWQIYAAFDACVNLTTGEHICTPKYLRKIEQLNGFDNCTGEGGMLFCIDAWPLQSGYCEEIEPVKALFDPMCIVNEYQP